jgi:hypothetical protein
VFGGDWQTRGLEAADELLVTPPPERFNQVIGDQWRYLQLKQRRARRQQPE